MVVKALAISPCVHIVPWVVVSWFVVSCAGTGKQDRSLEPVVRVKPTADFDLTGDGTAPSWGKTDWTLLRKRSAVGLPYETRIKVLHSTTGLYVLMDATDSRITATLAEDFLDLWNEDVFEIFLWTDERDPLYFEYEISPLGRELPILVPNLGGKFLGWRPWHYEAARKTRTATGTVDGPKESGAAVKGWRAEVFIPYALLEPLRNVPPQPGSTWRANFYRIDYDDGSPGGGDPPGAGGSAGAGKLAGAGGPANGWNWAPVGPSFHEFERFGTLVFE